MRTACALLLVALGCERWPRPPQTTVIGPEGGVASSADGALEIRVPPDALWRKTPITIETVDTPPFPTQLGPSYVLAPSGLRFARPVELAFALPKAWEGELVARFASTLGPPNYARGFLDEGQGRLRLEVDDFACSRRPPEEEEAFETPCNDEGQCGTRCRSDVDCAAPARCIADPVECFRASYCSLDGHCIVYGDANHHPAPAYPRSPPAACGNDVVTLVGVPRADPCAGRLCGEPCESCDPRAPSCRQSGGVCDARGACVEAAPACGAELPLPEALPGAGVVFALGVTRVTPEHLGLDVDGRCDEERCVDNALFWLGAQLNDAIAESLTDNVGHRLIELVGLPDGYAGDADGLSLRLLSAFDADVPAYPYNDFVSQAPGEPCCRFSVASWSTTGDPPRPRVEVPARIAGHSLTTLRPFEVDTELAFRILPTLPLVLRDARITGKISPDLTGVQLLLSAVVTQESLAASPVPLCWWAPSRCPEELRRESLLDLAKLHGPPDRGDDYSIVLQLYGVRAEVTRAGL